MKLLVVAVGHRMPGWVEQAWTDYARRLPSDCALELRERKPALRRGGKAPAQRMQAEERRIEAATPSGALSIAQDERGRDLPTQNRSAELEHWRGQGRDEALVIGGPDGLDPDLKK